MRHVFVFALIVLSLVAESWAQLRPPNEAGVSLGHWHALVRDVEAAKKFWVLLGGQPIQVDGTEVMKFPGVLVFLTPGEPSGGSMGTVVDHTGLRVPNGRELVAKLEAAGVRMDARNPVTGRPVNLRPDTRVWTFVYSPDDFRVEILDDVEAVQKKDLTAPISSDLLHFYLPAVSNIPEAQTWYAKMFGAQPAPPVPPATNVNALMPGAKLNFIDSRNPPLPTKGRALDHVGFEVKNLEAFCKKLEAMGIKFDKPYSKTRHTSFASAELTDPWGTSLELTEGLTRF